jgi:hypothetical protein
MPIDDATLAMPLSINGNELLQRLPDGLDVGAALEPKGVYVDLAVRGSVPFVAISGQVAGSGNRYVARRDLTVDTWNRLVEDVNPHDLVFETADERPTPARSA